MDQLIPGLPDDVARECLSRVPYEQFSAIGSICKGWKAEIESSAFLRQRKLTGQSQVLVVLAQARPNPVARPGAPKHLLPPIFLPAVFEPLSGRWTDLPPPPECSNGLPRFCRLAAVGMDLIVVGGLDPVTWDFSNSVYVYSFLTGEWRRGADMPGPARSFFGCASDGDRAVFVAGGHDTEKSALRSALAYDVEGDRWLPMPDMARERDECRGAFRTGGKFLAISWYPTATQGKFERSVEAFDTATWTWGPVQDDVLGANTSPRNYVDGTGQVALYTCRDATAEVAALRGTTWTPVAKLPSDVASRSHMMQCRGKLLVFGTGIEDKSNVIFVLDISSGTWTKVDVPEGFSGAVMEGCALEV